MALSVDPSLPAGAPSVVPAGNVVSAMDLSAYAQSLDMPWALSANQAFDLKINLAANMLRGRMVANTLSSDGRIAGKEAFDKLKITAPATADKIDAKKYSDGFLDYMAAAKGISRDAIKKEDITPANVLSFLSDATDIQNTIFDDATNAINNIIFGGDKKAQHSKISDYFKDGKTGVPIGMVMTYIDRVYQGLIESKKITTVSDPKKYNFTVHSDHNQWQGMRRFVEDMRAMYPPPTMNYQDAVAQCNTIIHNHLTSEEQALIADPAKRAQALPATVYHAIGLLIDLGSSNETRITSAQQDQTSSVAQSEVGEFVKSLSSIFQNNRTQLTIEQLKKQNLITADMEAIINIVQQALKIPSATDTVKLIIKNADSIKNYLPAAAKINDASATTTSSTISPLSDVPVGNVTPAPAPTPPPEQSAPTVKDNAL